MLKADYDAIVERVRALLFVQTGPASTLAVQGVVDEALRDLGFILPLSRVHLLAKQIQNQLTGSTYHVVVYSSGRAYGGPEEGGWWFDTGNVMHDFPVLGLDNAMKLQTLLAEQFPYTRNRSSVLGGEDYDVVVQDEPGADFPTERPRYE